MMKILPNVIFIWYLLVPAVYELRVNDNEIKQTYIPQMELIWSVNYLFLKIINTLYDNSI